MKKFIGHIVVLGLAIAVTVGFVFSRADGNADAFYLKFTSTKKSNLILGTSKAAQGLQPQHFTKNKQKKFYNYAFSMFASPYGKTYLQSIKSKLDTQNLNQIFILTVDPWSLCSTTSDPNDRLNFRETKSYLAKIANPNQKINYQYLLHHFDESYYKILTKNSIALLHDNGWLEVTLPHDTLSLNRRKDFTISSYQKKVATYQFSSLRYQYLLKTIAYLKNYGTVYLVRLPVHPELMHLENQIMPDFDQDILTAIQSATNYLNLSSEQANLNYTDGVHLTKKSGEEVSKMVSEWINMEKVICY